MKKILIITSSGILVVIILILIAGLYKLNFNKNDQDNINKSNVEVVNTNDPTWQTFVDTNQKITWQYPATLSASYISLVEWPPRVDLSKEVFSCPETGDIKNPNNAIAQKVVNNHTYCVETSSEGAAGSVYTTYIYSLQKGDFLVRVKFPLRYPQCYNYDDPAKTACENEHDNFALDALVDQIASSIKNIK